MSKDPSEASGTEFETDCHSSDDDALITDWIQEAQNGITGRLSHFINRFCWKCKNDLKLTALTQSNLWHNQAPSTSTDSMISMHSHQ